MVKINLMDQKWALVDWIAAIEKKGRAETNKISKVWKLWATSFDHYNI